MMLGSQITSLAGLSSVGAAYATNIASLTGLSFLWIGNAINILSLTGQKSRVVSLQQVFG